jgi:hypothetical protein
MSREIPIACPVCWDHALEPVKDDEAERKLLPVSEQPLKDIIVLMCDSGMRNVRELYRMRIENI